MTALRSVVSELPSGRIDEPSGPKIASMRVQRTSPRKRTAPRATTVASDMVGLLVCARAEAAATNANSKPRPHFILKLLDRIRTLPLSSLVQQKPQYIAL